MSFIDFSKITLDEAIQAIKGKSCKRLMLLLSQETSLSFSELFQKLHEQAVKNTSVEAFALSLDEFSPYLASVSDLRLIAQIFPNLKTLVVPTPVTTKICTAIQTFFPKLECIDLSNENEAETPIETDDPTIFAARQAALTEKRAKEIKILSVFVENMLHLKQLILTDVYDSDLSDYEAMIKSSKTLLTIGINSDEINLPLSTLAYLTATRDAFDEIKELTLDWKLGDTIETFEAIDWEKLSHVKKIQLERSMLCKLVEYPDLVTLLPQQIKIVNLSPYNTLIHNNTPFTEDEFSALITYLPNLSQITVFDQFIEVFTGMTPAKIRTINSPSETLQALIDTKNICFLGNNDELYDWSPLNSEIEELTLTAALLERFPIETIIATCHKLENITMAKALCDSISIGTIKSFIDKCKTSGSITFDGMPSFKLELLEAHKEHALVPRIEIELQEESESDDEGESGDET